jgi:hypothetical protein
MSIYNIYLSGNRVTRNRIKKEEGPTTSTQPEITKPSSVIK